jgi:peptidoglycan glycosyltransferase
LRDDLSEVTSPPPRRRRWPLVVIVVALLAAAGVALWFYSERQRDAAAHAAFDRAVSFASRNDVAGAESAFAAIDAKRVDANRYAKLHAAIEQRRSGRIPYVFDRNGGELAAFDIAASHLDVTDRDFEPLLASEAGVQTIGAHLAQLGTAATIDTTLDPHVQRAAIAALSGFRGSIVAIDPRTNEILAIASTRGSGALEDLALERQYEPGSVVKVLTGLNAVDSGVPLKTMFPYQCTGALDIDGRRFGDWVPAGHGSLETLDEALAVSCNIVFADLGLRLGADRVRTFMTRAGFDGQTSLGLYSVPLGRLTPPVVTRYDTASTAIGLEHETVTALHLAMLASMMANHGVLHAPRLLRGRRSILGDPAWTPPQAAGARVASENAAATLTRAMQAVVTDPRATGRHSLVEGVNVAMKTGTAGNREKGYDALIMAFAPVESPRIAFAVIAEHAGPAEIAGAKIAHDFVAAMFSGSAVPSAARSGSTGTPAAPAPAPPAPH